MGATVVSRPRSAWALLDGPTHYADFGGAEDGPLLVCVHGLGGSYVNWIALAPLLTPRARVVAVDLAGHGRTPPYGRATDVRANQRLLGRFLTEELRSPVILIGNSLGGLISLMQASQHPSTVAGLVLLNPALPRPRGAVPDAEIVRLFAAMAVPRLGEFVLARRRDRLTPEEQVGETLRRCAADPANVPSDLVAALIALLRERHEHREIDKALLGTTRSMLIALARAKSLASMIRAVTRPTMVVHGELDRLVPVAVARHLAVQRPDWRMEIRPGIGHIPQMEDAPGTAALILDWLDAEGAQATRAARTTQAAPGGATPS